MTQFVLVGSWKHWCNNACT